jgi:Beta-galactosidase trimerisation domain
MLSLETFTLEERSHRSDYPGRDVNAHQLEVLAMYQAVSQLGVPPRVKFFKDYDWDANTKFRRTVILPDVRAVTEAQVDELEKFVAHGNTLIITGLTGFYDPRAKAWSLAGFPLGRVTGGDLKEVHFVGDRIPVPLSSPPMTLPSHLWVSTIDNHTAQVIGQAHGETIATERSAKDGGRVIWIPSPIGLGAWLGETRPLAEYLRSVLAPTIQTEAFKFTNVESDCLMRVLHNGSSWVSIVANGGDKTVTCGVEHPAGLHGSPLWGQGNMTSDVDHLATFQLLPRGTAVTLWR